MRDSAKEMAIFLDKLNVLSVIVGRLTGGRYKIEPLKRVQGKNPFDGLAQREAFDFVLVDTGALPNGHRKIISELDLVILLLYAVRHQKDLRDALDTRTSDAIHAAELYEMFLHDG